MKRFSLAALTVVALLGLGGCKKRQATMVLEGSWRIVFYDVGVELGCLGRRSSFVGSADNAGGAVFERNKKQFSLAFNLSEDLNPPCTAQEYSYSGKWKVKGHEKDRKWRFFVGHQYTMHLDGHPWDLKFHSEKKSNATPYDGRDEISLHTQFPNGDWMYFRLVRDE